jgi:hypothetical protein
VLLALGLSGSAPAPDSAGFNHFASVGPQPSHGIFLALYGVTISAPPPVILGCRRAGVPPRMQALLASFQQITACPRPSGLSFPHKIVLLSEAQTKLPGQYWKRSMSNLSRVPKRLRDLAYMGRSVYVIKNPKLRT